MWFHAAFLSSAQKIGGQVIGAFDRSGASDSLVGFAMALPGISQGQPYLHSHMLAVNPDYRNQGIGRRLKLFQREEALARGSGAWNGPSTLWKSRTAFSTWPSWAPSFAATRRIFMVYPHLDCTVRFPLIGSTRNGGWIAIGFALALGGKPVAVPAVEQEISVPHQIAHWRHSPADQERVLDIQTRNREHFQQAFAHQLAVIGFRIDAEGNGVFQLGRWQEPELRALPNESLS